MDRLRILHGNERGQMAIAVVLTLLVVFMFFALAFDAGLWFFDHRTAQNQAEASALAAVQHLPDTDTTDATAAADQWLSKNGSGPEERTCLEYSDSNGDGAYETAKVCVRRESPGIFSALSGIDFVNVSASATATTGPAGIATVMPWAIVPPDPDCDDIGETCSVDLDGDGTPESCDFLDCPFGLNPNRLYSFKCTTASCEDEDYTPGNFGSIAACGSGVVNYRDCITGEGTSDGFEVGEEVITESQTGVGGVNTDTALSDLVEANGEVLSDGSYPCDAASTPDPVNGLDADVVTALTADDGLANATECEHRKVVVPIIASFPSGGASEPVLVLGLAVYYIANWDREGSRGDAEGDTANACGTTTADPTWPCGIVWGYLLFGQNPDSRFLLDQISDQPNPFAPLLIALID